MVRHWLLVCLFVVLAGCGFHPRGSLALASQLGPVRVQTADPYSLLAQGLSTALARAGATPAVDGQPAAVLRVLGEALVTRPLSVDQRAQVREYETRYRVQFDLVGADGKVLVPAQWVELIREYTYDASVGSPAEEQLIQAELRRDMQAALLRRIDAALRAD